MGQSLSTQFDEPEGELTLQPSGAKVTIYLDGDSMRHKVQERGLTADYPIAYSIGYGKVGRSYLIDLKGHLFQSPVSFYTAQGEWIASPGYEAAPLLDFSRAITPECLGCHAGSIKTTPEKAILTPLSCDRCHGDPENHLKNPVPGSIVNPAKLTGRERDSVCEQCHLEGATTVLNPGKTSSDFHPGLPLESVESHYVLRDQNGDLASPAAVSHAEQLAASACLRGSAGKLWCGTCHDPHGAQVDLKPKDRRAKINQVCGSCHAAAELAVSHAPKQDNCVGCHMPNRAASDITHAPVTDHRILKRPLSRGFASRAQVLTAWQPAPPQVAERNLGLAYFHLAHQNGSAEYFQQAYILLSKQSIQSDPEASAGLAYLLLGTQRIKPAVQLFEAAADAKPDNPEYWLDLGVAQEANGQTEDAVRSLSHSIDLDAYDYRPYKALSDLYKKLNQSARAQEVLKSFLKLVPESLTVRLFH